MFCTEPGRDLRTDSTVLESDHHEHEGGCGKSRQTGMMASRIVWQHRRFKVEGSANGKYRLKNVNRVELE